MFRPASASSRTGVAQRRLSTGTPAQRGTHGHGADRGTAAVWKQLGTTSCSSCRAAGDPEVAGSRRRPSTAPARWRRFLDHPVSRLSPTTFFLLVINIVYAFFDTFAIVDAATQGGWRRTRQHPGLQGLLRRLQGAGPGRLGGAVGGADHHRHRADGRSSASSRSGHLPDPPWSNAARWLILRTGAACSASSIVAASRLHHLRRQHAHPQDIIQADADDARQPPGGEPTARC